MKKSEQIYGMRYLYKITQFIALFFSVALIIAAAMEVTKVFYKLYNYEVSSAVQDGLFVLILLEMFYVVRSFIKYGSVNIALILNVGMVSVVKEIVFKLEKIDLYLAVSLSLLLLALGIGFIIESKYNLVHDSVQTKRKTLRERIDELSESASI